MSRPSRAAALRQACREIRLVRNGTAWDVITGPEDNALVVLCDRLSAARRLLNSQRAARVVKLMHGRTSDWAISLRASQLRGSVDRIVSILLEDITHDRLV